MEKNVSAIQTFSEKIGLPKEDVVKLIKELQSQGKLNGILTSDEKRFFKSDVHVSKAPVIERDENEIDLFKFDYRPGLVIASVGIIIIVVGASLNYFSLIQDATDFSAILFFVGLCILMIGLLLIARRKTPD